MDNRVYWIWLQNAFGAGSPKPVQLVRRIGSAEKLYQGGTRLWSSFSFVSDKELAGAQCLRRGTGRRSARVLFEARSKGHHAR